MTENGTGDVVADVISGRHRDRQYKAALERIEVLKTALDKINGIRNSIIGLQTINWSEHIYPLVAALDEAGFEGMDYPDAREYFGSMVDRTRVAEEKAGELERKLAMAEDRVRIKAGSISKSDCPTCAGTGKKLGKYSYPREDCKDCKGTGNRDGGKFFAPDNDACTHCTHCNGPLEAHHGETYRCEGYADCEKCGGTGYTHVSSGGGTEPRMPGTPAVNGLKITRMPCRDCIQRKILDDIKRGNIKGFTDGEKAD